MRLSEVAHVYLRLIRKIRITEQRNERKTRTEEIFVLEGNKKDKNKYSIP